MRKLLLTIALLMPSSVGAQPYSESMADCASVYQNAAQWVKTDESADKMMHAAIQWAEAAVLQAKAEGAPVSSDAIWQKIDGKTEKWEAKGSAVFFSQEFRDCTQYCRKFAKDRGVSINP
jgi:surface antigen